MAATATIDRDWILSELTRLLDAERTLVADVKNRGETPPDPSLSVLYHEIAAAEERHLAALETIATRYGHTPSRIESGGVTATLSRLKDKVTGLASRPLDILSQDLAAKATAIHWRAAWVHTFESLGDTASAQEMTALLTEDEVHRNALLEGLKRLVERSAHGEASKS